MIQNENSNSISSNSPETDEQLMKLQDHLDHREKKLKEMSFMLAELNNDLNTALEKQHQLLYEKKMLSHKLERKNEQITQEKSDKIWIEEKLIKLERQNVGLKEIVYKPEQSETPNNEKNTSTKLSNVKSTHQELEKEKEEYEETDKGDYQPPSFD